MLSNFGAGEDTFEGPLDCKEIKPVNSEGNQLWIFTGRTDAEAELQYFGHLKWRANSLEKTLMLGGIEGKRIRGQQRMRWLDSITHSMEMNLSKLGEIVKGKEAWHAVGHGVAKRCIQLSEQQLQSDFKLFPVFITIKFVQIT